MDTSGSTSILPQCPRSFEGTRTDFLHGYIYVALARCHSISDSDNDTRRNESH